MADNPVADNLKIHFARPALNELRSLSASEARMAVPFLERLARNPYDQTLLGSAHAKGDLFASSLGDRLYVYWSFDVNDGLSDVKSQPEIKVLGFARKGGNRRSARAA